MLFIINDNIVSINYMWRQKFGGDTDGAAPSLGIVVVIVSRLSSSVVSLLCHPL